MSKIYSTVTPTSEFEKRKKKSDKTCPVVSGRYQYRSQFYDLHTENSEFVWINPSSEYFFTGERFSYACLQFESVEFGNAYATSQEEGISGYQVKLPSYKRDATPPFEYVGDSW